MNYGVFVVSSCLILGGGNSLAQDATCSGIHVVAEMARAKSMARLLDARRRSGDTYRARLVFAYRAFELQPKLKTKAESLLTFIPKNEDEQTAVMTLGDSLCDGESAADMISLSRVRDGFAHQLTQAVAVAPQFMSTYIRYSLDAVVDPHSDYPVQMKRVCERDHARFLSALKALPPDAEGRFKKYVMDPRTCHVIAVPEAEE